MNNPVPPIVGFENYFCELGKSVDFTKTARYNLREKARGEKQTKRCRQREGVVVAKR